MKRILFLILVSFLLKSVSAQHLGAYTDYRDRFYIFDHGKSTKVEDLRVQSFDIGGGCVLYINSQGNLKLYSNGAVTKLEPGGVTYYTATDHLAAYSIFEKLKVVEEENALLKLVAQAKDDVVSGRTFTSEEFKEKLNLKKEK